MKPTLKIVGILWMVISAYFFSSLLEGTFEARPDRLDTLTINLFFVVLYLAGSVTSFYVLIGARWARIVLSIVAILTVIGSVMGLFAFFNSLPFSFVGIAFDIFALASAGVLLFVPKYAVA
ncbi:MAG: hypothetical protein ACR2H1_05920 [Limisphaerales bacterium]